MMKNNLIKSFLIISCLVLLLFSVACSNKQQDLTNNNINYQNQEDDYDIEHVYDYNQDTDSPKDSDKVNFKCVLVGVQTIYFLKDKAKVSTGGGDVWIDKDHFYMVMDMSDEKYLIQHLSTEDPDMTLQNMHEIYRTSKMSPHLECELDVVTESDVQKPNYPILTEDEFQEKMMEEMMQMTY
jgi:hypothetical protein